MVEESLEFCMDGDKIVKIKLNTGLDMQKNAQATVLYFIKGGG